MVYLMLFKLRYLNFIFCILICFSFDAYHFHFDQSLTQDSIVELSDEGDECSNKGKICCQNCCTCHIYSFPNTKCKLLGISRSLLFTIDLYAYNNYLPPIIATSLKPPMPA